MNRGKSGRWTAAFSDATVVPLLDAQSAGRPNQRRSPSGSGLCGSISTKTAL